MAKVIHCRNRVEDFPTPRCCRSMRRYSGMRRRSIQFSAQKTASGSLATTRDSGKIWLMVARAHLGVSIPSPPGTRDSLNGGVWRLSGIVSIPSPPGTRESLAFAFSAAAAFFAFARAALAAFSALAASAAAFLVDFAVAAAAFTLAARSAAAPVAAGRPRFAAAFLAFAISFHLQKVFESQRR